MNKDDATCIPCGLSKLSRNTYFNGKLLVERDFTDEQTYHIAKQRMLNASLHGAGTVCGLKVLAHLAADCRDRFVYVEPGVALDCCGREIVVPEKALVRVADLIAEQELSLDGSQDLFITLCYREVAGEPVPVVLPSCDCADQQEAPNRIEECFEFRLLAEPPGTRLPVRPPVQAQLDWVHTLTLAEQGPRALAADDELQQVYVAALASGEGGARIYAYRTDNHDLITALDAGEGPVDLAVAGSGALIYLAGEGLSHPSLDGPLAGLAVYRESEIRTQVEPAALIDLGEPARIALSPRTGALFALKLASGELLAWSEEALGDWLSSGGAALPATAGPAVSHSVDLATDLSAPAGAALRGATILDVSLDGRYLFVADANAAADQSLRVVNIARLFANETDALVTPTLPGIDAGERAVAVRVSRDSRFVYLLTRLGAAARLHRYEWDATLQQFLASGHGGQWNGEPRDLALAPDERWAYVLQGGAPAVVQVIDIEPVASVSGTTLPDPVSASLTLAGDGRFARLAGLGKHLYVTADDAAAGDQPERGLVAVLDIEEADCGELFLESLDGCPQCEGEECVVLAHLPGYVPGQRMQDPGQAEEGDVAIDNVTYRPLVPSTERITEVIRCMLEEGIAAGVPGPRGPSGQAGPGIAEVALALPSPAPGDPPSVTLEDLPDSPDRRLVVGIPPGAPGQDGTPGAPGGPGPRGPGITEVQASTLTPGSTATAALQPIAGDPEGDQRLVLGIPRGDPGVVVVPELTHITNISWVHDQASFANHAELLDTLGKMGLVIAFDRPVQFATIARRDAKGQSRSLVFELLGRRAGAESACWCPEPNLICEPVVGFNQGADGRIIEATAPPAPFPDLAPAVRLVLPEGGSLATRDVLYRVVFRADFALDENDRAVDGNHIGGLVPGKPSGNGQPGGTFESWFDVLTQNIIG